MNKRTSFILPERIHKKLKIKAAEEGKSMAELVAAALEKAYPAPEAGTSGRAAKKGRAFPHTLKELFSLPAGSLVHLAEGEGPHPEDFDGQDID